jgi:hypothetical protein
VLGSNPGRLRCRRMYDMILCSPSPGTLESDNNTLQKCIQYSLYLIKYSTKPTG